ncbi:hypothetical protein PINS_up022201, partial [Pythium insidiosum]
AKKWWLKPCKSFSPRTDINVVEHDQCRAKYGKKTKVCDDCRAFVAVVNSQPGCHATVGFLGRGQHVLNIRGDCESYETFLHEWGTSSGFTTSTRIPREKSSCCAIKWDGDREQQLRRGEQVEAATTA